MKVEKFCTFDTHTQARTACRIHTHTHTRAHTHSHIHTLNLHLTYTERTYPTHNENNI